MISEGQGYGLLAAAAALTALPNFAPSRPAAIERAYQLFLGWRAMCVATSPRRRRADDVIAAVEALPPATSCQEVAFLCSWALADDATTSAGATASSALSRCLPSWKFDPSVSREVGTGSAPDGDEDALLGMILLLLATRDDAPQPPWWLALHGWTYQSALSFLHHSTSAHPTRKASNGAPLRVLKLGSCWGGFDCTNPSYLAPAHYRAFRDFMAAADRDERLPLPTLGGSGAAAADSQGAGALRTAEDIRMAWDSLIEASYAVLHDAACPATGLVPNWFVPSQGDLPDDAVTRATTQWPGWTPGTATCSGSGTPAAEFGAEASRTVWRVALDALWHSTPEAVSFCNTIASHLISKLRARNASTTAREHADEEELDAPPSCHGRVESVHRRWSHLGFMLGPMAPALMVPLPAGHSHAREQQPALDIAAALLAAMDVDEYYSGSWVALATLTLDGPLAGLAPLLATMDDADELAAAAAAGGMKRLFGAVAIVAIACLLWRWRGAARGGARSAGVELERLPLSEEEWTIHYDRSGRPYWSDGRGHTTWNRPAARPSTSSEE